MQITVELEEYKFSENSNLSLRYATTIIMSKAKEANVAFRNKVMIYHKNGEGLVL